MHGKNYRALWGFKTLTYRALRHFRLETVTVIFALTDYIREALEIL